MKEMMMRKSIAVGIATGLVAAVTLLSSPAEAKPIHDGNKGQCSPVCGKPLHDPN
jgi:hypothetical protein